MIMIVLFVVVCFGVAFGAYNPYDAYSDNKALSQKIQSLQNKLKKLCDEFQEFANKIATYNKPVFEVQLTKKEREMFYEENAGEYSPTIWNSVWAKDKTIVLGCAPKNKKFVALFFKTSDPDLSFSNGIRVGASSEVLERYLGDTLINIGYVKGNKITLTGPVDIEGGYIGSFVTITCVDGVITEISLNGGGGASIEGDISKKALDFANKKAKEMNISSIDPNEWQQWDNWDGPTVDVGELKQKAERGDAGAQGELGIIYWTGSHGVAEDGEKALYWLKKAAAQNDINAMEALGKIYRNGFAGVKKDDKEADYWFNKRAQVIQSERRNNFKNNPSSFANAVVTGDKVNVRSKPSTSAKVVAQLNKGHLVLVTKNTKAKDGYWYFIETASGTQGWVFGKYLKGR